jgi:hypothetical protein
LRGIGHIGRQPGNLFGRQRRGKTREFVAFQVDQEH